jgi:hypothetical protein
MNSRPNKNPVVIALYVNAAVLLAILIAVVSRSSSPAFMPAAFGQPMQAPIAGGAGIFVMPAQFHANVWGCYLLDVDRQTLCTYEYQAGEKQLKLTAARNFRYDKMLKDFDTFPAPADVQKMVEQEEKNGRVINSNPGGTATPDQ